MAALVAVWAVVWGILSVAGVFKMTPEKIVSYVEENPLSEGQTAEERRAIIEEVAARLNALDVGEAEWDKLEQQRRQGRELGRDFFSQLTPEEQRHFLELRIGKVFEQMMTVFNDMAPEKRKRVVERTLRDMEEEPEDREGLARLEDSDPEMFDKIVNEGLRSYYKTASAETKLDLAPVLEKMQSRVNRMGR